MAEGVEKLHVCALQLGNGSILEHLAKASEHRLYIWSLGPDNKGSRMQACMAIACSLADISKAMDSDICSTRYVCGRIVGCCM